MCSEGLVEIKGTTLGRKELSACYKLDGVKLFWLWLFDITELRKSTTLGCKDIGLENQSFW